MRPAIAAALLIGMTLASAAGMPLCHAKERWPGVDEAVVEKFASENGRPASSCILDLEGDALLFAFLLAGAAGGFVMGYHYRGLTGPGKPSGEGGDAA